MDLLHETMVRHDESIRDLEYKHLATRHHLRGELLQRQHQVELSDQREYMQRAELEQKQRHLSEAKQQPKNLKVTIIICLLSLWLSVCVNGLYTKHFYRVLSFHKMSHTIPLLSDVLLAGFVPITVEITTVIKLLCNVCHH